MHNRKIIKNAGWIIGGQIGKSVIGFVISLLTARYLGPSNFGLINYAASIVTFVTPIMYLGLNGILVQEIINTPKEENKVVGTAIGISFLSSICCIIGIIVFISIANPNEKETKIVCLLYSTLLVFQSVDLIQYWYQAKLLSKYSSIVSLCAYFIVSIYKLFLLITRKSVEWFAVSNALDYLLISIALIIIYKKLNREKLSFSIGIAKRMLSRSKYYIISDLAIVVFAQTDRIMLKLFIDDMETGYYSAAVVCAGLASFVFGAIINSMRPVIYEYKSTSYEKYEKLVVFLYNIVIYLSLLYSAFVTLFAPIIISVLYGDSYYPSIIVLQIIVWYCAFSYLGGARDIWILAENKQKHLVFINSVGAITNVLLNIWLIPLYGAVGASIASLITQFFVNIALMFIYPPLKDNGRLIMKAANPLVLKEVLLAIRR